MRVCERQRGIMERWQKPEAENCARAGAVDHPSRSSLDYNTPLRSARGDATASPSPFYKLSSELSRESLRIPGAVPFMWEQRPGRRKFMAASMPSAISPRSIITQPQAAGSFVPGSLSTMAADPAKPNLATLFRQPSLKGDVAGMPATADSWPAAPISSAIAQISPPPAADHPRSSSASYSVMLHNMPPGPSLNNSSLHENGETDAVSEEDMSDALTATAGEGLSADDSLMLSGVLRPASTPSEARDFIMNRFLPAAHTIACESPRTPSRRFLPPVGVAAAPASPGTPARSNGSFRDHVAASRPSPLRYASASSTPASNAMQLQPIGQLRAGIFHGDEEDEEEEEEEPPFTSKACGIFPFHISISFHNRHTPRASPSPKHQHNKQQQHQKKISKSVNRAGTPTRIMDILHDDHSSIHDDDSPVHRLRSKQSEAERERTKIAVLERAGLMYASSDPRIKPPFDSYYRGSPNLHQAQQAASELYNEEAAEYSSFQDASSRFQSPSPASRGYNMQSPLVNSTAQRRRSFADDHHPAAAIISTTEKHLNSSFYYYNMHTPMNKPPLQLASPCSYHTPLSSHVSASHQTCAYHLDTTNITPLEKANHHGITTPAEQTWDAHSPCNHLAQKTHIINNALYEHEDQEANMVVNANCPSMFTPTSEHVAEHVATYSPNCTRLNQGTALKQAGPGGGHACAERNIGGDHYVSICDHQCVSRRDQCVSQGDYNGTHHGSQGDYHLSNGHNYLINGGLHGGKGDHQVSNGNHHGGNASHEGDHNVNNNYHYASKDDPHYVINGNNHVSEAFHYVSNGNYNHLSSGGNYVSNDDLHGKVNSSCLSNTLLSPPLPKSPTHSWLDRARPLVASTNKSVGASSRFAHMHKATTPGDDHVLAHVSMSKMRPAPPSSAEAPKWEALVKGSHLQPGHLRFSEELYHRSQNVMKVRAS